MKQIDTLLPTKLASDDPSYSTVKELDEALTCAKEKNIRNIALTGPFGSGKSSVLRTLMEDFSHKGRVFLPISLATLQANEEENNEEPNNSTPDNHDFENLNRKIEYSILQQLIYREETKNVPNSRFRRIVHISQKSLTIYSLESIVTLLAFLIVFEPSFARVETLYRLFNFGTLGNTFCDCLGVLWLLYAAFIVSSYIIKSYSNSKLNKLNLKDGEIEVVEDNSIFNKHLDEILYFFQVTKYNVVIIEDLDRFGTSNIFLKLRELNQLINESKIVGRHITFIYAIKDDVFKNEERTKFFDYITTVIPVINPSNSKDKLKNALKAKEFSEKDISDDDLSEMAFFIQDMRILTNIVNEYKQYHDKLFTNNQQLNPTKLLAMIVYKNYFPQDFALLHRREGKVYTCISKKRAFISEALKEIEEKKENIKKEEQFYNESKLLTLYEYRLLFLYKIREKYDNSMAGIKVNDYIYSLEDIAKDESLFNNVRVQNRIEYEYYSYYGNKDRTSKNINMANIDDETKYSKRINSVRNGKETISNAYKKIEKEKIAVKSLKLKELFSEYNIGNTQLYKNIKLAPMQDVFLRLGYIDEEYYDYISYFYEGMVSLSDRDFLLSLKRQIPLPYEHHIDRINNFVKELKPYMFESDAILNNELLDFFAASQKQHENFVHIMLRLEHDNAPLDFLAQYYNYGKQQKNVFDHFIKWNEERSWGNILNWKNEDEKCLLIQGYLKYCQDLCTKAQDWINGNYSFLTQHSDEISLERCHEIIEQSIFNELNDISSDLLECSIENDSYTLSTGNLVIIVNHLSKDEVATTDDNLNYSRISFTQNAQLIQYVSAHIQDVLSQLNDTNKDETPESLLFILNSNKIEASIKEEYLQGQNNYLDSYDDIMDKNMYDIATKCYIIAPSWENVSFYYSYKGSISNELIKYLEYYAKELADQDFPQKDGNASKLFVGLFASEALSIESYKMLLNSFNLEFNKCEALKELSFKRLNILISQDKIPFKQEVLSIMNETSALAEYLIFYSEKFIENLSWSYSINAHCLETLLSSPTFSTIEKMEILQFVSDETKMKATASEGIIINAVIESKDINLSEEYLLHLLKSNCKISDRVKLAILIISAQPENTEKVLAALGNQYAELSNKGKRPTIKATSWNESLLKLLQQQKYISSYQTTKGKEVFRIFQKSKG